MIKIRYRDPNELSPGLFAAAESHGRGTIVYLLSGLTPAERRAALRRLRLSARMGHCTRLPGAQLGLALVADRVRTGVGRAGAVFRSHPAGSTVPVMMVSAGAIAFLLFSTVSIRVLHPAGVPDQLPPSFPAPSVSAVADPVPGWLAPPGAGDRGARGAATRTRTGPDRFSVFSVFSPPTISGFGTGPLTGGGTVDGSGTTTSGSGMTSGSGAGPGGSTGTGSGGTGTGSGGTGSGGTGSGGTGTGGGDPIPTPTPTPIPTPTPTPIPTPTPSMTSPAPSPSPSASPTPTSPAPIGVTSAGGGNCLDIGPLGICLDV